MYPLLVMAAPGAARFLQTAVSRSYRQDDSKTNERKSRWDPLIHAVPHGAASESAFAHRTGKGEVTDEWVCGCQGTGERAVLKTPFTYRPENGGSVNPAPQKKFLIFPGQGSGTLQRPDGSSPPACRSAGWTGHGTHEAENAASGPL